MRPNDLTTSDAVIQYMGSTGSTPKNLDSLIGQVSRAFHTYMERHSLLSRTVTETYDGLGGTRLTLRQYPATSIATNGLSVQGLVIQPTKYTPSGTFSNLSPPGYGYLFTPWDGALPGRLSKIDLAGAVFPRLPQCIQVTYTAGYLISNEAATVPASNPFTVAPQQPLGRWVFDNGVTYASTGAALAAVAASPGQGQYVPPKSDGTVQSYTFSSADQGAALLLSYSFVPYDLEEACIEQVAERFRYSSRVGQKAVSEAGQITTSYAITDIPPYIKTALQPYRRIVPLGM